MISFFVLMTSLAFAQTRVPFAAGSAGCIEMPKTFSIPGNPSFKKISFIKNQTLVIESEGSDKPLQIDCNLFADADLKSQNWKVSEKSEPISLKNVALDFLDQENRHEGGIDYVLTNKNEDIVRSKIIIHSDDDIELHDSSWGDHSIRLFCGFDPKVKQQSVRLDLYNGKKLVSRYETLRNPKASLDPHLPSIGKKNCPAEDYELNPLLGAMKRFSPSENAPASSSTTSGTK